MSFEECTLWKSSLAAQVDDPFHNERKTLRDAYFDLRNTAAQLVENISGDLRTFTIHDITHLDALWGIASEIVGPDYLLSPTEAFSLGAAFLLHDAGMCLAAYPGGLAELKSNKRWPRLLQGCAKDVNNPSEREIAAAVIEFLRVEHANRAQELPSVEWKTADGGSYYLIEKAEIRQKFGYWIGEIAASHWWTHDKLAQALDRIVPAPPPFPTAWNVDLLKVASILRVSDAAHVDERRAPGFVRALRTPTFDNLAALHWLFQNRLTQPERRSDALHYSSTSEFQPSEIEAWWLAFDTLRMINGELRSTDVLLADLRGDDFRFGARRVANVESTKTMVNSIRVSGWIPVDTEIRISDVPHLIETLGGVALYGDRPEVPIRELVQNAVDAIRLKSAIVPNFKLADGKIGVSIGEADGESYLLVADNGIGMTKEILTGPFLDFGNSGWSKDPAFSDFPNVEPGQMKMIGKFGIGFFPHLCSAIESM